MLNKEELAAKLEACPAPRVTAESMNARIGSVSYVRLGETMTHCTIILDNGFATTGESACVDPLNYDKEIGEGYAYENAYRKLWAFFGFLMMEDKFRAGQVAV